MEMIPMMILITKDGFSEFVPIFVMPFTENVEIQLILPFLEQITKEHKLTFVNLSTANHL